MKRLFSCFLFQKRPAEGLSASRRAAFWLWNSLLLGGGALGLGLLSLVLAPVQYGWPLFWGYTARPSLMALNLIPPVVLAALLYGITGRPWLAYVLTALPVLGLSFGNYYKLVFRDDPVVAADLLLLNEAGNMAGKYQLFLTAKLMAALVCALLGAVALALLARGKPQGRFRTVTAGAALACALALIPVYNSDSVYWANANEEHINRWSPTQQYVSRGVLYPFLHSIKNAIPSPPEGYDQGEAAARLAEFEDADIPEDRKVNIVGVMLEAFTDFSQFEEIQFAQDIYAAYHSLEAASYSGTLLVNIFAGGTVNTERAFLTGVGSSDYDYRSNTSSYVWYLKSQGYRATGDHPSPGWFYNRANVNPYLGFDEYRFAEDHYRALSGDDTAPDRIFYPELTASILEQLKGDQPLFSFSVSYQGHGPYGDSECWWGEPENYISNSGLDDPSRYILSNYLGTVLDTQKYLMEMVDAFRPLDEPVVLVLFGDHKPWLGNGNSVYNALGIDLTQESDKSFYNYWSTRYLIWANDAAKEALGTDLVGEGPDISPCFLMNVLFEQLGWTGDAFMQAADQCRRELPVVHNCGVFLPAGGRLTRDLTEEQARLDRQFRCLGYYREHHFNP